MNPSYEIPVYRPSLLGNEKKYVNECLDSTWISSKGKFIQKFEESFAQYTGIGHAASVCNGTVAIHLALAALDIQAGDEVIVPTLTYIASVNAIRYTGAKPVFVDCVAGTWQVDPAEVEKKITKKTKAILCVHIYGFPCEMDALQTLAKKHGLYLVEDCAEAFGTLYNGKHVGGFGDVATFSFFGNKTITSGEGGMVTTNDPALDKKLRHLKGQGLAENREYWHDIVGFNYRMTNLCAAIGLAQLERADHLIQAKLNVAEWYQLGLEKSGVWFHSPQSSHARHSFWMCSIAVDDAKKRDPLRKTLAAAGIETRPVFFPIHQMPIYFEPHLRFPISDDIASRGINLPSWPDLQKSQVDFICDQITKGFKSL